MTRIHSFRRLLAAFFAMAALFGAGRAGAQGIPPIFSDTEIEQTIRTFCRPIWIAAGLNPDDVRIILVNDPEIQAFVAGGQNIFIFTGLLAASDNPSQIIGVVAHETGHIAGAHLARSDEDMADASYTMLLATVLGAAAAAGSRDPGAMAGALGIGEDMGIRSLSGVQPHQGSVGRRRRPDIPRNRAYVAARAAGFHEEDPGRGRRADYRRQ